jgi:hypothetical protein
LEKCDELHQSWTEWQFKSYIPITGEGHGVYNSDGSLNVERLSFFSRTYPHAIAGNLINYKYDQVSKRFQMSYSVRAGIKSPTDIYLNEAVSYISAGS